MSKIIRILESLAIMAISVFAPIKSMIIASLFIVILDLITGVISAAKQKQPITSSGLKQTIIKLFVYEIALIVGFILQQYLLQNSIPVTNLVATLIACTEGKSILENLEIIAGTPFLQALIGILSNKQNNPE